MPGKKDNKALNAKDEAYDFRVGTMVGFKGLQGEMKLKLDSDFDLIEDIVSVELTVLESPTKTRKIVAEVESFKMQGKTVLLRLFDFDSRNAIEHLVGAEIYTQRSQLRDLEEDEWWFNDLVGLTAYTTGGARIGTVSAIVESGNYLLEIEEQGKTYLVPFVKELVPVVDIKGKRVEIADIPGLLE